MDSTKDGIELRDVEPDVLGAPSGMRMRRRDEDTGALTKEQLAQEQLSDVERKWALAVVVMSAADIVASMVIICTSFKYAYLDNGVSLYSLAMQAISHWLSSVLLLLRFVSELFCGSKGRREPGPDGECLLREQRRVQLYREQGLSTFMGIVMLISSCALLFKAFRKLRFWNKWHLDHTAMDNEAEQVTEWLAWVGFFIYVGQAIVRLIAAQTLKTCIVSHACVASIISLLYLLILGIAASYEKEWSWKAEPIAAIALAFVTLFEGVRIVYYYIDDMDTRLERIARA